LVIWVVLYLDMHVAVPPVTTTGSGLAEMKVASKTFKRKTVVIVMTM
jgi:hypothetical protein